MCKYTFFYYKSKKNLPPIILHRFSTVRVVRPLAVCATRT